MSRKLVVTLFAFLFAALAAWADPGGEGGCVNLPGRSGSHPGSVGGAYETTVVEQNGVMFVLPPDMLDAAALLRGVNLPYAFVLRTIDGTLRLPAAMLAAMRGVGDTGFTLDFVDPLGNRLQVVVTFLDAQQLHVY